MIRVRERNNNWTSFVDLFSNLVIILIFLLIVLIFLWTTTSVFSPGRDASDQQRMTELRYMLTERNEALLAMEQELMELRESDDQARLLLVLARDELLALEQSQRDSADEKELLTQEQLALIQVYETKLHEMQSDRDRLVRNIERLSDELRANQERNMGDQELQMRAANLQLEIERMNSALAAADAARATQEVEFAALSEQLNKAMADRLAQQNELMRFQSEFYGAIREALGVMEDRLDLSSDRFVVPSDILFASGSSSLTAAGRAELKKIADIINDMTTKIDPSINWIIRVDGHADRIQPRPNASFRNNMELSLLRAQNVVNELIRQGVAANRLSPAGFGDAFPLVEGRNARELAPNRRIELRLTNQ